MPAITAAYTLSIVTKYVYSELCNKPLGWSTMKTEIARSRTFSFTRDMLCHRCFSSKLSLMMLCRDGAVVGDTWKKCNDCGWDSRDA
jgi:hypothetical protein